MHQVIAKRFHLQDRFHQILNNVDRLEEQGEAPAAGMMMTTIRLVAGKKSTTQDDRSGSHRGGATIDVQIVVGMIMMAVSQTIHLLLATVVGMMTISMILADTTHMNHTPTMVCNQETEEEEAEITIEGVENAVEGAEEDGVEETEAVEEEGEEEEGLMLVKKAEAVTMIPSRVPSRSI